MSGTSQPITPEAFLIAIRDLDLERLHAEAARLYNSIYHLRRSNVALEEFKHEVECSDAIDENNEVICRQEERILMIRAEVERRGFRLGHGGEESEAMPSSSLQVDELTTNGARINSERDHNLHPTTGDTLSQPTPRNISSDTSASHTTSQGSAETNTASNIVTTLSDGGGNELDPDDGIYL